MPRHWGGGRAAIADGTHVKLRENNLLGSRHIRYGGYGGIAYHHIADSYIALFTSFIPCGVWEAVHILDALLKNRSEIQPDTLHADTQGQSEPVFGLCRLLGIKLMPRMRGLSDAIFYRPAKSIRYQHIDALFGGEIDWDLIATHARDMIQVVLSIQAGRVMPSMLLRKLGTYNRRSLLYRAFRELGRVERTLFLLRFISSAEVRRTIRAETTKIEAYNDFLDWVSFGGPVIKSGDPVEQEKQLKYASLVANTIMLSNVADMTDVLSAMAEDGHPVTPAWSPASAPIRASTSAASASTFSTWTTCPARSIRSRSRSSRPCDHFLHVSSNLPLLEALIGYVYPVEGMDPMPPTIDGRVLAGTQDPIGQAPGSYVTGNAPSRNPLFPPDGNPDWLPPDGASTTPTCAAGPGRPGGRGRGPGERGDEGRPGRARAARRLRAAQRDPGHDHGGREARERRPDRERRRAAQADLAPGRGEPAPGRRTPAARLGGEAGGLIQQSHAGKWLLDGHQDVAARELRRGVHACPTSSPARSRPSWSRSRERPRPSSRSARRPRARS